MPDKHLKKFDQSDSLQYLLRIGLVGVVAGLLAVLFQIALNGAEGFRHTLVGALKPYGYWSLLVMALFGSLAGGLSGWLTGRFAPEAAGSGIPHVKGVLLYIRALNWRRILPVKFIGGILSIGAGLSLGREGPTVQMGASAGKAVSDLFHLHGYERQLIAAGGGAGLAAAFNAPLAGVVFVIEEMQRELSAVTYGSALVAAVVADTVARTILGQSPSFHMAQIHTAPLEFLPFFLLTGVITGLGGALFNRNLLWILKKTHRKIRLPRWALAAFVGTIAGVLSIWIPEATGGGHSTVEAILNGRFGGTGFLPYLAVLLVVKYAFTMISYASGVPGGIFAPLLALGAVTGAILGQGASVFTPSHNLPLILSVAAMAGAFSSIVRAPLTGVVLILEMTSNYSLLFPILVTCMASYLTAEKLANKPIYEALLEYDLERNGDIPETAFSSNLPLTLTVESDSRADGASVKNLPLPPGCLLLEISRPGSDIIPNGSTVLKAGDQITAIVHGTVPQASKALESLIRTEKAKS